MRYCLTMLHFLLLALASVHLWVSSAHGFGLTESGNKYIVDTSGGLIFTGKTLLFNKLCLTLLTCS